MSWKTETVYMGTSTYIADFGQLPCGGTAIYPGSYADFIQILPVKDYIKCEYCKRRNENGKELCSSCGATLPD